MTLELCRLCLSKENLTPIFIDSDNWRNHSKMLSLSTGLVIVPNDGLPQSICFLCTNTVNRALNLRKTSHLAEVELINRGYRKISVDLETEHPIYDNITKNELGNDLDKESNTLSNDSNNDWNEDKIRAMKIEVQCDRLSENGKGTNVLAGNKNITCQNKRQKYLDLVDGILEPNGPVKCKVCKKTVSKWQCFISHAKIHLGFNFVCEYCGKSFIASGQLKRHCRSHHGMERELKCRHCSYLALDNVQLKLHERRVHTGERPFVCDECSAAFHSRRGLLQHIESHRTLATVQCEKCPRAFKSQRHLSRHRYSAHGTTRVRCPHCDKAFTRKYLRSHVATHHPDTTPS